jgi:hypothetical protein
MTMISGKWVNYVFELELAARAGLRKHIRADAFENGLHKCALTR